MLPALLFAFVPATAPALTYAAPARTSPATAFKLTTWDKGEHAFIGTDLVNLREAASADAAVRSQLDFGTRVTVLGRGPRVRLGRAVNCWYQVEAKTERGDRTGYVFGATLSPFLVEADLDDDGVQERFSVGWTDTFAARVRAFEPDAFGGDREAKARFVPGGTWKGGRVTKLASIPKQEAGLPLLELDVLIGNPTAPYQTTWRTFYAYHPPADGGRGPGELVEQMSTYRNNDIDTRVTFDPNKRVGEVRFVEHGKVGDKVDRYPLTAGAKPEAFSCTLDAAGIVAGGPPGAKMRRDGRFAVFTRPLSGGVRLRVSQGGCEHFAQVWRFEGVTPEPSLKGRARQAVVLLKRAGGQHATLMSSAIHEALATLAEDDEGNIPCGDATCSVTVDGAGDRTTLIVSYDFPL